MKEKKQIIHDAILFCKDKFRRKFLKEQEDNLRELEEDDIVEVKCVFDPYMCEFLKNYFGIVIKHEYQTPMYGYNSMYDHPSNKKDGRLVSLMYIDEYNK